MKVAVSVPDSVFEAAERLARDLKKSRSQLYSEAIAQYVGARNTKAVTDKLNVVYAKESSQVDETLVHAQFQSLSHETW